MYGSTNLNELNDESTLDAVVRLIGNPASGELYLSDIRSKAAVSLERYGRYLAELFREHCITVPPAVNLQAGLGGEGLDMHELGGAGVALPGGGGAGAGQKPGDHRARTVHGGGFARSTWAAQAASSSGRGLATS